MSAVGDISTVITSIGGSNGIGDDVANIIGSIKGTNVPQNVTYVTNGTPGGGSSTIWIVGGGLLMVLVLVLVLNK